MMAYGKKADWESAMNAEANFRRKEGRYSAARVKMDFARQGYMAGFIEREELEVALDQLNEAEKEMQEAEELYKSFRHLYFKAVRPLPQY